MVEKRLARTAFEITLEGLSPFLAFESGCRVNLPRREFGCVRDLSRIMLDEALFQVCGFSGVSLPRMRERLLEVNVMEIIRRVSPPSPRGLRRAATAFHADD